MTEQEQNALWTAYGKMAQKWPSQTEKRERYRQSLSTLKDVGGDCAEFGVWQGGGTRDMALLAPERTVWAFDTFEGIPAEDYNHAEDSTDPPGKWKINAADPAEMFEGFTNVKIVKGRFADTLPSVPATVFVLVHIDCDLYQSYNQVLTFLETHLAKGAHVYVDDYALKGARRAVDEWVRKNSTHVEWDGLEKIVWI